MFKRIVIALVLAVCVPAAVSLLPDPPVVDRFYGGVLLDMSGLGGVSLIDAVGGVSLEAQRRCRGRDGKSGCSTGGSSTERRAVPRTGPRPGRSDSCGAGCIFDKIVKLVPIVCLFVNCRRD